MDNIKKNKYLNKKVKADGFKFDSQREYQRYIVLKDAESKGVIANLEVHPKFQLIPAMYHEEIVHLKTKDKIVTKCDQKAITYTADFRYSKGEKTIVEDVKISEYLLPKEFLLKEKLLFYFFKIKIRRIYKPSTPV